MRLLITRPLADARPLARELESQGHETVIEPLLRIEFLPLPDHQKVFLDGAQALLVTSANGVRAFAQACDQRSLPVYAVGDASARAATEAGFANVQSAGGDVLSLAERVKDRLDPQGGALVHVAGSKLAGDLAGMLEKSGFQYRRVVLYRAEKESRLSPSLCDQIAAGQLHGVLLFSPRSADAFISLVDQADLISGCGKMTAYCLSPAVAKKAGVVEWRQIRVARQPDQNSLIETLREQ